MPPKTAAPESSHDMVVNTLCEMLIMGEFKIDNTAFAPIVGLKDGKNVPRKIDSLIKPFGFTYSHGKITRIGTALKTTAKINGNATEDGADAKAKKAPAKTNGKRGKSTEEDTPSGEEEPKPKKAKTAPKKGGKVKKEDTPNEEVKSEEDSEVKGEDVASGEED